MTLLVFMTLTGLTFYFSDFFLRLLAALIIAWVLFSLFLSAAMLVRIVYPTFSNRIMNSYTAIKDKVFGWFRFRKEKKVKVEALA